MLRKMIESMADGVIMTDEHSEVSVVNPAARHMLGIGPDVEVTAKFLKDRLGFYPFDLVVHQTGPVREELKVSGKVLHSIVTPVRDGGRLVGVAVVLRDITEWKELERRKDEFVSIVSHELRTPLTSITGAIDIVLNEHAGDVPSKQRRYLKMARDSCMKLHGIVDDLLDVARLERGKMPMRFGPLALDLLVGECVERFLAAAETKRIDLTFVTKQRGVRISGDPDRLVQVILNLLSNALNFTPDGGRVEVEVFGPGVVPTHVGVSVWNNGEPIPEEAHERVFDKFEQVQACATRRVGGTGLGLAISRAIVEGHGGRIWVEPVPTGTKFVFTLPTTTGQFAEVAASREGVHPEPGAVGDADALAVALGAEAAARAQAAGRSADGTVLVLGAERDTAYILKGALLGLAQRVLVAGDADEALALARRQRPDLILVDARLPGVDLLALVELLRRDPATRKAQVVLAAAGPGDTRGGAIAASVDACLDRPLEVARVCDTCAELLTKRGRARSIKVLVVDDDPSIRLICREVLGAAGHVVAEACDGAGALREAASFRPDLLLLDVMLPDMDGFQVARQFWADPEHAATPIVCVSARWRTADKIQAFTLGADDYLVKPFDTAELVLRVEKAIARREHELAASDRDRPSSSG